MSRKKLTCASLLLIAAFALAALTYAQPIGHSKSKAQRTNVSKNIVQRL